jgi:hypothetical protein
MGGRCRLGVGRRESGGKPGPRPRLDRAAQDCVVAGQELCGRDRIRTCVGNAGDFTVRSAGSSRVPRHPRLVPDYRRDVHETACRQLRSSPGVPARSALSRAAWRRAERKWSEIPWARARAGTGPRSIASAVRLASDIAPRPSSPLAIAGARPRRRLKSSRGVGQIGTGDSLAQGPLSCSWRVPPRGSWRLSQKL